jgi:hypothetical protein
MFRITSTEVILPSALSAEARHHLTDSLYAVHARLFESEAEREAWASRDSPEAPYFLETAMDHAEGHGLLTVEPITLETVLSMACTLLKRRLRQSMMGRLREQTGAPCIGFLKNLSSGNLG